MFISPSEYWRPGMGMTAFVHLLPASGSCCHARCGLCQTTPGIKAEPSFLSAFGQVLQHQERPPRVWAASSEGWRVYSKGRKVLRTDTLPFSLPPSLLPLPSSSPSLSTSWPLRVTLALRALSFAIPPYYGPETMDPAGREPGPDL